MSTDSFGRAHLFCLSPALPPPPVIIRLVWLLILFWCWCRTGGVFVKGKGHMSSFWVQSLKYNKSKLGASCPDLLALDITPRAPWPLRAPCRIGLARTDSSIRYPDPGPAPAESESRSSSPGFESPAFPCADGDLEDQSASEPLPVGPCMSPTALSGAVHWQRADAGGACQFPSSGAFSQSSFRGFQFTPTGTTFFFSPQPMDDEFPGRPDHGDLSWTGIDSGLDIPKIRLNSPQISPSPRPGWMQMRSMISRF